jgi:hypothetical protein
VKEKEHKYIDVISFLLTNKRERIGTLYTDIYTFPAEQPDKEEIGHCMFIHILNKYYVMINVCFWWAISTLFCMRNDLNYFFCDKVSLHSFVKQTNSCRVRNVT